MVNTDFYMETLNFFQLHIFSFVTTSFIFLINTPVVSDKWLKLLSTCFKFRIKREHNNKMVIQSVFSKQITKFNIQMKGKCSVGPRSS